LNDREKIVSKV